MKQRRIDWIGIAMHTGWLFFWLIFYFIWGKWKWRTAAFGTPEWMFDNIGHAIFGIVIALNLLYEISYFFPAALLRPAKRALIRYAFTPAVAIIFAAFWEVGEMIHDFGGYAVQAQKGGADTTIDILITFFASFIGVLFHSLSKDLFDRLRSEETEMDELQIRVDEWDAEGKELAREIKAFRRRRRKELPPALWNKVRDLLRGEGEENI